MSRAPTAGDWFSLFALTIFWGTSFGFIELALRAFPPSVLVAARITLGAFALLGFMLISGYRLPRSGKVWAIWSVVAFLGVIMPMRLTTWGQLYVSSAEAGVLMAISPLFVYSLAHFFIPGERMTTARLLGFVVGFSGVVLVIGPAALLDWSGNMHLIGALAVLGAALSYSINTVLVRRVITQDPMALATGVTLLAMFMAVPAAFPSIGEIQWPPGALSWMALLILGLISTGFASVLYFRMIQGPGPGFTAQVTYLVPAWAVLAGALVLQEQLALRVYLGLGLILGGIAISELAPALRRRHLRRRMLLKN